MVAVLGPVEALPCYIHTYNYLRFLLGFCGTDVMTKEQKSTYTPLSLFFALMFTKLSR
jgi:hypothetical protein